MAAGACRFRPVDLLWDLSLVYHFVYCALPLWWHYMDLWTFREEGESTWAARLEEAGMMWKAEPIPG